MSVLCYSSGNSSTLYIDMGTNGSAFEITKSIPIAANAVYSDNFRLEGAYIRARLVNDQGVGLSRRLQLVYHTCGDDDTTSVSTVITASALPAGASTDATLQALSAKLPVSLGPKPASGSLSVVQAAGSPFYVNGTPSTTYRNLSLTGSGQVIKLAPGLLRGASFAYNGTLGTVYVKLYDQTAAPSSTDTPFATIMVEPGHRAVEFPSLIFAAGLGIRASSGPSDADVGVVAPNSLIVEWLGCS